MTHRPDRLLLECAHRKCEVCGQCSGSDCASRGPDDWGRVTTDRAGRVMHTDCRRDDHLFMGRLR